jgi:hypothetical protein
MTAMALIELTDHVLVKASNSAEATAVTCNASNACGVVDCASDELHAGYQ